MSQRLAGCGLFVFFVAITHVHAVGIHLLNVGDPGNPADKRYNNPYWDPQGYGRVDHFYGIGKFEVTAGQYCAFLNAVAATDTYGLYSPYMSSSGVGWAGCNIQRTGSSGSYRYSVAPDWANRPVTAVSWGDAVRFCNWLSNGQPTGPQSSATTERGSYSLDGATTRAALSGVRRTAEATYVLPTEDEWYKAAYYDPYANQYWDYATRSNVVPSNVFDAQGTNNATYRAFVVDHSTDTIGAPYYRTEVGSFPNSLSAYRTVDQSGNVSEWTETGYHGGGDYRVFRGGFYANIPRDMSASSQDASEVGLEFIWLGFRVAYVPDPASLSLMAIGALAVVLRHRP